MPVSPGDEAWWLSPKWFVVAIALAVFGLAINYDLRLGLAAGALLAAAVLGWLYLALRYPAPDAGRNGLVQGVRQQASNRRLATERMAEAAALRPQQGADPAERP